MNAYYQEALFQVNYRKHGPLVSGFFFIYQHFAFPPLYIITFSVHVVGQMMIFTYATKYKSTEVGKNEFLK